MMRYGDDTIVIFYPDKHIYIFERTFENHRIIAFLKTSNVTHPLYLI